MTTKKTKEELEEEMKEAFKRVTKKDWTGKVETEKHSSVTDYKLIKMPETQQTPATKSPISTPTISLSTSNPPKTQVVSGTVPSDSGSDENSQSTNICTDVQTSIGNEFEAEDQYASLMTPSNNLQSVEQLGNEIMNFQCSSFTNRTRVIYTWICVNDMDLLNFPNTQLGSCEYEMMARKGFLSNIFCYICEYMQIPCHTIEGSSIDIEDLYEADIQKDWKKSNWNTVGLDSKWQLLDCNRGKLAKSKNSNDFHFWFLTPAHSFIYYNVPDEPMWNLTDLTVNYKGPKLWPMYFMFQMKIVKLDNRDIVLNKCEAEIYLDFPKIYRGRLLFKIILKFMDNTESIRGEQFRRFTHTDLYIQECRCIFHIRPPETGYYKVIIQSKLISSNSKDATRESESAYSNVCRYDLQCLAPIPNVISFPKCKKDAYGPSTFFKCFPMSMSISDPVIVTSNPEIVIDFYLKEKGTDVMLKLKSRQNTDDLSVNVNGRKLDEYNYQVSVRLPQQGEFGLEVSAFNASVHKDYFKLIWQYFIIFTA